MSSFAINGRIVFDAHDGPTAFARATPSIPGEHDIETRRCGLREAGDPRVHVLELVAALACELRALGHQVSALDID